MAIVLLTGFEPFGGSLVNPSEEVARAFAAEGVPGATLHSLIVPVVGGDQSGSAFHAVAESVIRWAPDTIVAFGESHKATRVAFERVAINLRDDRIPDHAGVQLVDQPIVARGAAAHFSSVPLRAMRDACEGEGIPAELSNSAGTFLCNELMYRVLGAIAQGEWPSVRRAGFVHLPQLPEQAAVRGGPSMRLADLMVGLRASLRVLTEPLG